MEYHFIDYVERREEPIYKKIFTPFKDDSKTLKQCGLKDNDLILIVYARNGSKDVWSGKPMNESHKVKYRGIH